VYNEVELITYMTTVNVVGGKIRLITYEFIIVLLASWIGSYGPNL
jgi:hypothetical protein